MRAEQGAIHSSYARSFFRLMVQLICWSLIEISFASDYDINELQSAPVIDHRKLLYYPSVGDQDRADTAFAGKSFVVQFRKDNKNIFRDEASSTVSLRRRIDRLLSQCQDVFILYVYDYSLHGGAVAISNVTDDELQIILDDPDVLAVEWDGIIQAYAVQDGLDESRWGLDRIDQKYCATCDEITRLVSGLDNQYRYDWTGLGVQAYIVDSGIQSMHNEFTMKNGNGDLFTRAICGFDFVTASNQTCEDEWGHGTYVAGIIGGNTFGVAKNASLIAIKVFGNDGKSRNSDVIAGIEYIIFQKILHPLQPMLMNLSLGSLRNTSMINEAVNRAVEAGVTVVSAAGNGGVDACTFTPASAALAITVGASTKDDKRHTISNWGKCVDLYAPGSEVSSAWIGRSNDRRKKLTGTSVSAPFVSGAVALYLERDPTAFPGTIKGNLLSDAIYVVKEHPSSRFDFFQADNEFVHFEIPRLLLNLNSLISSPFPTELPPSNSPSNYPSYVPSTLTPSTSPSVAPTDNPSATPTINPSATPTINPSAAPVHHPSGVPSNFPSFLPTIQSIIPISMIIATTSETNPTSVYYESSSTSIIFSGTTNTLQPTSPTSPSIHLRGFSSLSFTVPWFVWITIINSI